MIHAVFTRPAGAFSGVSVSGHAGYAEEGYDIVCAAVSSAVQLVSNGITEVLGIPVQAYVGENIVDLKLHASAPETARHFIEALYLHLDLLSRDYGGYIEITTMEE